MGLVRRHPFLTSLFVIGSLPVLFLIVLEVAQRTPACSNWRAEVDGRSELPGKLSAWDEYHRGEMSVDEYYGGVREHVAHEMRDSRPWLCE